MCLHKFLKCLCISVWLFFAVAVSHANESATPGKPAANNASQTVSGIPYKQEPKSFAEQSLSTFFITFLVLGAVVAGLYTLRNYLQKKTGRTFIKTSSINIKERVRLSPKLSMYVVAYRDKEILVAQIGDTVTPLAEYPLSHVRSDQAPDRDQESVEHHAHS